MQFYNTGGSPLSDVTIRDNVIETHNSSSHGAVHIREGQNDTLIIDIDQPGPDHVVRILDMAHAYF